MSGRTELSRGADNSVHHNNIFNNCYVSYKNNDTRDITVNNNYKNISPKNKTQDNKYVVYASRLLHRDLKKDEATKILNITDNTDISDDMLIYLLEYSIKNSDNSFLGYMQRVYNSWIENKITSVAQAQAAENIPSVLKSFGITGRNPVPEETALIIDWQLKFGYGLDIINEAASRTIINTGRPNLKYADKVLISWFKSGVKNKNDIDTYEREYKDKAAQNKKVLNNKKQNKFENFNQRTYDFAKLEERLLSKVMTDESKPEPSPPETPP